MKRNVLTVFFQIILFFLLGSTAIFAAGKTITSITVGAQQSSLNEGTSGSTAYTITLAWSGGSASTATLGVTGLPSGVTVGGWVPSMPIASTVTSVALTLNYDGTTTQGTYGFTVNNDGSVATGAGSITIDAPLPVELTAFTGFASGNVVTLNWTTATEVNNYGFEVYRDGAKVGFVQGHGNSNSPKNYSFTDKPTVAKTFSYQLKQVDFSGLSKMYGPVLVKVDVPAAFVLHQNYPNPYNPSTTIKYEVPFTDRITLKVYNLIGQEVATLFEGVKDAGTYEVKFDGRNLASGIYLYSLTSSSFTKNIKMLLLK